MIILTRNAGGKKIAVPAQSISLVRDRDSEVDGRPGYREVTVCMDPKNQTFKVKEPIKKITKLMRKAKRQAKRRWF